MITCKAVKTTQVKTRGKSSVEWHDKENKPRRYCYGYQDRQTEELLPVCKECKDNVTYAQEDADNYWAREDEIKAQRRAPCER